MEWEVEDKDVRDPHWGDPTSHDAAREAVEVWLGLRTFIDDHKGHICERLEACERSAREAPDDPDLTFFAEGLPAIDSVIRVGSSRTRLKMATERVQKQWPDTNPHALLSMLTFKYIVSRIVELWDSSTDDERRALWNEISKRVGLSGKMGTCET